MMNFNSYGADIMILYSHGAWIGLCYTYHGYIDLLLCSPIYDLNSSLWMLESWAKSSQMMSLDRVNAYIFSIIM